MSLSSVGPAPYIAVAVALWVAGVVYTQRFSIWPMPSISMRTTSPGFR